MSYFDIKNSPIGSEAAQIQTYAATLAEYIEEVNHAKCILKMQGESSLFNIDKMNQILAEMTSEANGLQNMKNALMDILALYGAAENKLAGAKTTGNVGIVAATGSALTFLKGQGVTVDDDENPLTDPKTNAGNWGNIFGGLGESTIGIAKFLSSGFSIVERAGKYFIQGGKEIRTLLNLPKNIKVSSVLKAGSDSDIYKNIQKAFKADKFLNLAKDAKLTKVTKGLSKAGTFLAWASAALDVGEDIYDNVQNGAAATKVVGDAIGDSALAAGGVAVGSFGASKGAAAGAAIGTMICPGAGTLVGGIVGGVGGAFASGWVYSKVTSMEIGGKSVEEWVDAGCTKAVEAVADVGSKVGQGISNACSSIKDTLSGGWDSVCGLFG